MKFTRACTLRSLVLLAWLSLMGWFVRYEAFPEYFTNTLEGYRDVLSEGQLFVDSWMKIMFKGKPIGLSHTSIEVADNNPLEHYRLSNRTLLSLNIMGEAQQISASSGGSLDLLYHLQRFDFSLVSRRYSLRMDGERASSDKFRVKIRSDLGTHVTDLEIPDDVILYSPLMEMSMSKLAPGDHLRVRTLDPASMTISDVMVQSLRREPIALGGRVVDALALSVEYQGVELMTWIDRDGKILRQETPLGWTMESCSAEEAMSLKFDSSTTEDLLTATAVPCEGRVADPAALRSLHLRFSGAPLGGLQLASDRQRLLACTGSVAELVVQPAQWPSGPQAETKLAPFLVSSPFVQSDDPALRERAASIVEGHTTDREKARAIFDWVFRNVDKKPTASMPSALDVLKHLEGDCNEHTYLFVGLARAAGLPAQIKVGLVYKDSRFYYHAWPSVFVGGWVEMDPTIGQELVDATHVCLLEGEIGNQIKLFSVFGRLRAEVLEQTYD